MERGVDRSTLRFFVLVVLTFRPQDLVRELPNSLSVLGAHVDRPRALDLAVHDRVLLWSPHLGRLFFYVLGSPDHLLVAGRSLGAVVGFGRPLFRRS
ncbi:hypothetical protein C468_11825 [Halorubrum kocurii JCM 14978]|uniref:Uncharacterized protein n=1 Tax=Halorubrum kocurii JCM 14978 TaxID=1230456 RepID=M0NVI6_9EURY|nr:hypothetical protein C468_11825 [Halorubrum kocurii JCM 14978]